MNETPRNVDDLTNAEIALLLLQMLDAWLKSSSGGWTRIAEVLKAEGIQTYSLRSSNQFHKRVLDYIGEMGKQARELRAWEKEQK